MKKNLLKFLIFMFLVIPCTALISACKDKTSDGVKVLSIAVEFETLNIDYVSDTNTLRFEYGTKVVLEKDDLNVTANYDDETSAVVSDYEIDLSKVKDNPNVGTYEIEVSYAGKSAKVNVEIYPKKIAKPIVDTNQIIHFQEDTIADVKLSKSPESTFDENTMTILDGSVYSATDAGVYNFKVIPNSNHVWEDYDNNEREEVVLEWEIEKAIMYASKINSLLFEYEEGVERTIIFDLSREQFIPFNEFFEVSGTISATEVGEYSFVIKLKEDKKPNYKFFEIYREEGIDFEYNADRTEITYFWKITDSAII